MEIKAVPFRFSLEEYEKFAREILRRWKSGNPEVIQAIKKHHPHLQNLPESEIGLVAPGRNWPLKGSMWGQIVRAPSGLPPSVRKGYAFPAGP